MKAVIKVSPENISFKLQCLLLFVFTFINSLSFSQNTFTRSYNYGDGFSAEQTNDSGYICVGRPLSLVRINSLGDTLWTKALPVGIGNSATCVHQVTDGFIITGNIHFTSLGSVPAGLLLLKTDTVGNVNFIKSYSDSGGYTSTLEKTNTMQQTTDGGYILTGYRRPNFALSEMLLIKTDSLGDTLWTRSYLPNYDNSGISVAQTFDGDYIIASLLDSSNGVTGYGNDACIIKADSIGNPIWCKAFGRTYNTGSYSETISGVLPTLDGGFAFAGNTASDNPYLIKINDNGDTLWTKEYSHVNNSIWESSFNKTSDNGFIILIDYYQNFILLKVDSLGDVVWCQKYDIGINAIVQAVQQTSDGGYIVTGSITEANSSGSSLRYIFLFKTDSVGNNECNHTDITSQIVTDFYPVTITSPVTSKYSPGCTVTSYTDTLVSGWQAHLGDCAIINGINDMQQNHFSIVPNPVHETLSIALQSYAKQGLRVFNVLGQEKYSEIIPLTNQTQQITIDVSHFETGIYFIKIGNDVIKFIKE